MSNETRGYFDTASLERVIAVIKAEAEAMRSVGVLSMSLDGLSFQLSDRPVEAPGKDEEIVMPGDPRGSAPALAEVDPMNDPETFGGILPGYDVPASVPQPLEASE